MKIAMGCDHGGIHLKEHIKKYLIGKGIEIVDHGTYTEDSCDYPDYAAKVCKDITSGASGADRGILICGTYPPTPPKPKIITCFSAKKDIAFSP